jgi:hypothetical protein
MSDDSVQNKNAASEDDVGTVHRLVTDGFKMKIGEQVKKAKKSKKASHISTNDLAAAARWCAYNKVQGRAASDKELEGVVDELDAIRKKYRGSSIKAVGDD